LETELQSYDVRLLLLVLMHLNTKNIVELIISLIKLYHLLLNA